MVAATLLALSLLRHRSPAVPRRGLGVALACHALAWTSTLRYQLPLEMQLDRGAYSPALLAELWRTDWLRKLAFLVEIPVLAYLAWRFFRAAGGPAAAEAYAGPAGATAYASASSPR